MRRIALLLALAVTALSAQTSRAPLPADIDAQSYSRLPLILKDSLDAEGKRIFEVDQRQGRQHAAPWPARRARCTALPPPSRTTG